MTAPKSENSLVEKAGTRTKPCPICGKPAAFATRPFCSTRCADIDLHHWLSGVYAIPAEDGPAADTDEEPEGRDAAKN